ncbi:TonB-dependent receptor [Granulicella arctica]|uniref:TonB-dependent receptor n=1 Tax=Granulicella arctica TaxID=940613 RepID=UPI0021E051AA|nr:carboxypeptidase regulatory-like domain-containing protein [Granulicella arctica]
MTLSSISKHLLSLTVASAFVLSTGLTLHAQTSGVGNITGNVTDASGAAVPNAPVLVLDTDTGVSRSITTNSDGSYTASFLQPGHYEVTLGGGTFGKVDRKNLVLTVGQFLSVDAVLPAASVTTEVVVTSQSPLIDTDKTEVSQTVDQTLISNLPVNGRNWSDFVLLTPNVVQDGGTGLVSFHGISGLYNQNYVDGANNNQMLFSEARGRSSGAPYVYSLDSIKEFQAETSNYSVEFGQAVGGQVNAITKSGTNAIHGDLFYYLRYPTLNALDPVSKYQALHANGNPFLLTQPIHQQQQFGGSVGGPIIKDRLFYFFTYDGFRRVGRALYTDTNTISLTPSGPTANTNIITPTQCPTTITAAQCQSGINFLLTTAGLTSAPPSRFSKENIFFPRLDYHINSKNDVFVNYNFANFDSTYGYAPAPTFSNSSPSTNGPTSYHERFLVAGLTTQVSGRSVNQVHFQYGRDLETAGANASGPSVAMGAVTYGMPNALPRIAEPDEHRTQITDVFSTVHGHHSFKFGGDANIIHEVMINLFQGGGVYGYSSGTNTSSFQGWIADSFRGQPGDTDPFAGAHYNTFVQTVDQINTGNKAGLDDFWFKIFDGFAEDSWKVRQNLTVNIGVRYDIQLTPPPIQNNTNFAPLSTTYSSTIKNVTNRVQPRIGFSYSPHPGTVFRGGYGLYSGLNQGSTYYAMRVENGVVQVNYNYQGCTNICTATTAAAAGLLYPNVPFSPTGPPLSSALFPSGGTAPAVAGAGKLGTQSFHGLDPNFVPPLSHEAEFGMEQALPGKISLGVGYVGSRSLRLPVFLDANLIGQTPHGSRSYNVLDASNNLVKQITVPVYILSDRRDSRLQSYNTGFSVANAWYNSLAVTVRRPFANGLEVLGNYTWARATDTDQVQGAFGTFYGGNTVLDPNNVRAENGLSDIDVRNRFVLSLVYQPQLFHDNKWAKNIIDGFVFSGTETASAGQPIVAGMSGTVYNGSASSYGSAGGIYGGAISSGSGAATTGRPPQIGRNSIVGPGFNNLDFRVSRDIPIHDSIKLQFIGEAFNLANHRIITSVNSTYSTYVPATATSTTCKTTAAAPAGSPVQGCITPFTGTGTAAFDAASGTNNTLYGPRQLQVSAKLFF